MTKRTEVMIYAAMLPIPILISYGMAHLGEPRAYWIWHTMLGVM